MLSSLEKFREHVMAEAKENYTECMEQLTKIKDIELKHVEDEALQTAYDQIQRDLSLMNRKKSRHTADAFAKSKASLLMRREEIIDSVFKNVTTRLNAFIESPQYLDWIREQIQQARDIGDCRHVALSKRDKERFREQLEEIGIEEIDEIKEPLGGLRIYPEGKNIMVDCTFSGRMNHARHNFIGLKIDE